MLRISIARGTQLGREWSVTFLVLSVILHTSYTGALKPPSAILSAHPILPGTTAWRIYHLAGPQTVRTTGGILTPITVALIESGAIYSLTAITLLFCTSMNSRSGQLVVMDAVPPLVVRIIIRPSILPFS